MWRSLAVVVLGTALGGAAVAQTSGGGALEGGAARSMPPRQPTSPGQPIPPGESAADRASRGLGTSDFNSNSATGRRGGAGSGAAERPPPVPLGPGTGARDTRVPDSSVYNPGTPAIR